MPDMASRGPLATDMSLTELPALGQDPHTCPKIEMSPRHSWCDISSLATALSEMIDTAQNRLQMA